MSTIIPECAGCRLLRASIAMLEAEKAQLRCEILDLTRPPSEHVPTLEITGMHVPERLAITGPSVEGPDLIFYRVSLMYRYRNQLSACCELASIDPPVFLRFFEDLAQSKNGWEGEKKVASMEGQLAITCTYEGKKFRPEVSMDVYCAMDLPSFDPFWTVQLHLDVDPKSLEDFGVRARALFANVAVPGATG